MKNKIDFSNPPAGKIYVPIPTNEEDIKLSGIDKAYVTTHIFSATKILCKMVLVDEKDAPVADAYIEDVKTECKRHERQRRCIIESPRTGKQIRCPDCNKCGTKTCPLKDLDTTEDVEKAAPLSYEKWIEDDGYELESNGDIAKSVISEITAEMFMQMLAKKNPALEQMTRMLMDGDDTEKVMAALNIKKSRFYEMRKAVQKLHREYFAD